MRLVADVGGTNSRLALSEAGQIAPDTTQSYANADWTSLENIIVSYLATHDNAQPSELVIAVAGPVQAHFAVLTNRDWVIDTVKLADRFGFGFVHLMNDLTALGYAVPSLKSWQLSQLCQEEVRPSKTSQSLVVGIGTGFNVSPVLQNNEVVFCPAVEAGHVSMPLSIESILREIGFDSEHFPTVEDLFSGRGFANFCHHKSKGAIQDGRTAISKYGASGNSEITLAIDEYAMLLGYLLCELSLAYLPSSGIYIAGSVGRSILDKAPSKCIDVRVKPSKILASKTSPIWVIKDDAAALTGCAGYSFR